MAVLEIVKGRIRWQLIGCMDDVVDSSYRTEVAFGGVKSNIERLRQDGTFGIVSMPRYWFIQSELWCVVSMKRFLKL